MEERRFYVVSIQYNMEKKAENRTVPVPYPTYTKAKTAWHDQLQKDGKNPVIGWSICMVIDNYCNVLETERYDAEVVPEVPVEE